MEDTVTAKASSNPELPGWPDVPNTLLSFLRGSWVRLTCGQVIPPTPIIFTPHVLMAASGTCTCVRTSRAAAWGAYTLESAHGDYVMMQTNLLHARLQC